MNMVELLEEARDALGRVNTNAFERDLLFQYRGGVLGRELTLIVRDLADGIEGLLDRVETAERELEKRTRRLERVEDRYSRLETSHSILEQRLQRVRELVTAPCTPDCCEHCDGKNEGWEMVLNILDREGNDE